MSHVSKHYDTLGVQKNATVSKIHRAHDKWVRNLHPWAEEDADERWVRQQVLDRVNVAYDAVLRSRRRAH